MKFKLPYFGCKEIFNQNCYKKYQKTREVIWIPPLKGECKVNTNECVVRAPGNITLVKISGIAGAL